MQDCYADHALIAKIELDLGRSLGLLQDFGRAMEEPVMAVPGADIELHRISELLRAPSIDDDCTFAGSDAHDLRSSTFPPCATGSDESGSTAAGPGLFESESGRGAESGERGEGHMVTIHTGNNHSL